MKLLLDHDERLSIFPIDNQLEIEFWETGHDGELVVACHATDRLPRTDPATTTTGASGYVYVYPKPDDMPGWAEAHRDILKEHAARFDALEQSVSARISNALKRDDLSFSTLEDRMNALEDRVSDMQRLWKGDSINQWQHITRLEESAPLPSPHPVEPGPGSLPDVFEVDLALAADVRELAKQFPNRYDHYAKLLKAAADRLEELSRWMHNTFGKWK